MASGLAVLMTVLLSLLGLFGQAAGQTPAGTAYWRDLPKAAEDTFSIGANAECTRLLMMTPLERKYAFYGFQTAVLDMASRTQTELFLPDFVDVEQMWDVFIQRRVPQDRIDDVTDDILETHGSIAAAVLAYLWQSWPQLLETHEDTVLLENQGDFVVVKTDTGAVIPLFANTATLSENGWVVLTSNDGVSLFDPATGTSLPVSLEALEGNTPLAARRLSDGSLICVGREAYMNRDQERIVSIVLHDAEGSITGVIDAGAYRMGSEPDRLLYSEPAGVGLAYTPFSIRTYPPLIFNTEAKTVGVLWMDGPTDTHAKAVDPAKTAEERGIATGDSSCMLLPLSISRDGTSVLMLEMNSAGLLLMDLETLQIWAAVRDEELRALFEEREKTYTATITLSYLGWNGESLLTGRVLPESSVLVLSFE